MRPRIKNKAYSTNEDIRAKNNIEANMRGCGVCALEITCLTKAEKYYKLGCKSFIHYSTIK